MDAYIREIKAEERDILKEFLYHAIYIPEGKKPYPKEIVYIPEAYIFVRGFGTHKHDFCLVADNGGEIIGAIWSRMEQTEVKTIGKPEENMPEIALSVLPQYRGKGVGANLLRQMLHRLKERGYAGVTLSVYKNNPAHRLYSRSGFATTAENPNDYVMNHIFED